MEAARKSEFTADDLLATAQNKLKKDFSNSWLRKLVRDGLLAAPDSHGIPGQRGGRQPGTWSAAQFAVFSELLEAMNKGAKRPDLCNLVVDRWIVDGPEKIPTQQVLRALRTYRDAVHSRRTTHKVGLGLTTLLEAEPETMSRSMRKRFADAFTVAIHDRQIDPTGLNSKAFGETIADTPLGRWLGPLPIATILKALKTGALAIDHANDEQMEFIRQAIAQAARIFKLMHGQLSHVPRLKRVFESPSDLLQRDCACSLVMVALGVAVKLSSQTTSSS